MCIRDDWTWTGTLCCCTRRYENRASCCCRFAFATDSVVFHVIRRNRADWCVSPGCAALSIAANVTGSSCGTAVPFACGMGTKFGGLATKTPRAVLLLIVGPAEPPPPQALNRAAVIKPKVKLT